MVVPDWHELAAIISCLKSDGKVVVTTNGIFDVLHVGHLRYLQQARSLGDILVIGINTDASTRALKGTSRPIVPQSERAELLDALKCVDYVTYFDESTPCELLETLKPNIHAKGGDYVPELIPETVMVRKNGGEVMVLPFVAGHSTTDTITRILQSNTAKYPTQ